MGNSLLYQNILKETIAEIQNNLCVPIERGLVKYYETSEENNLPIHIYVTEDNAKEAFLCCPKYNLFTSIIPRHLEHLTMKEFITYKMLFEPNK